MKMNITGLASLALFASSIAALPLPLPLPLHIHLNERTPLAALAPAPVPEAAKSAPAPFLPPSYLSGDPTETTSSKRIEIVEPDVVEPEVVDVKKREDVNIEGAEGTEGVKEKKKTKREAPLGPFYYEGKIGLDR